MGMEFKKPLIIGDIDASVKSDISQIKQDVSDIESDIGNLDNLTTTDKSSLVGAINEVNTLLPPTSQRDYIDNSKAMPTGAVSTNDLILPEIKSYAHSTFDLSKFTVVGSPNITSDGVYNGTNTNTSNYLSIANNKLGDFTNAGSFIIYSPIFTVPNALVDSTREVLLRYASRYDNHDIGLFITIYSSLKIACAVTTNDGSNFGWDYSTNALLSGHKYQFKFEFTGTAYKCSYKDISDDSWITFFNHASTDKIGTISYNMILGQNVLSNTGGASGQVWSSDLDLKQFSITVDGLPVFSGNKTGIDTVKPDDYTVVGTPTISADGIASGFSDSNYLTTDTISAPSSSYERYVKFNINNMSSSDVAYINHTTVNMKGVVLTVSSNYKLGWQLGASGSSWDIVNRNTNFILSQNIDYIVRVRWDGYTYYLEVSSDNGNTYTITDQINSSTPIGASGVIFGVRGDGVNPFSAGFIDLNAFKIYVDGELVYQPCLKIPYAESKTGSKIVSSPYRDRVNDMAEQFGYANYYTLSDTDFTLPQVELYGLIERQNFAPSNKYKDLTLGASGNTYVAPSNGYFMLSKASDNIGEYAVLTNEANSLAIINSAVTAGNNVRVWLPVKKNDVIKLQYTTTGVTNLFRFIYSEGSEGEAQ